MNEGWSRRPTISTRVCRLPFSYITSGARGSGIRYGWLTPPSFSSNFPRPYLSRHAQADAALKNRRRQFGIDGEAVILGAEGKSNFHVLHSGKHGSDVNRRWIGTPYRHPQGTPLSGEFG